ncbi:(d)CMP kinase [Spiroplasma endosymbiont of Danaus chrysippus]|uniref:(d)CMP kinase n=1 Tax=Spiroplasma endosymbiont of Danaus chrysippus TaxID=2691041 RepID=UPI00157B337C|nr:(d)CMP kinase [Spiroplasma endosymbiont of Danaus chrysippus]
MYPKINIAVDGPAASGKSAAAYLLSKKIDYQFMDTGIMYRSFTNYCLKNKIAFESEDLILAALQFFDIRWVNGHFLFNDQPPTEEIYDKNVTSKVPIIASLSEVRKVMVTRIQEMVRSQGFIVVGRDISSVVLPDAQLKIFLTSSLHARSERRYKQYIKEGINITQEQVYNDMVIRDNVDKTRSTGQLVIVEGAVILDNSDYNLQTTVDKLKVLYDNYFSHKK